MRVKKEFIKRNIAGECVVVPVGDTALSFNGLISLNDVGEFLWDKLQKEITVEQLVGCIMDEYEVEEITAKKDVIEFVSKLLAASILEE